MEMTRSRAWSTKCELISIFATISESETLDDFGKALHLMRGDLEHLRNVFMAVETGDTSLLR